MPKAFIAMPFDQRFYHIYKIIRKACEALNVQTVRIDEVWAREDIYKQIEEEILRSEFMIADFTGDRMLEVPNPNVVHEAAFARTHKKYLIILAQDHKCLPFDWRTRPATIYQDTEQGLEYLQDRLVMAIRALMQREDFGKDQQLATQSSPGFSSLLVGTPAGFPFAQSSIGPVPYPNMPVLQQDNTPYAQLENLLQNRSNQETISFVEDLPLPPGFEEQEDKVICQKDGSEMVKIPATSFTMGGEEDDDQQPVHEVSLSPYLMDIYPINNAQYAEFIEAGGYQYEGFWSEQGWAWRCDKQISQPAFWGRKEFSHPDFPVIGVSWYEAVAYATWANKHLPSEAQWELAARGVEGFSYPWGEETPSAEHANYLSQAMVDIYQCEQGVSPFGCYQMAGNIWEWCNDWYQEDFYQHSPPGNPLGPAEGDSRVCRGGSWTYDQDTLKTYHRFFGEATLRDRSYGFRCARIL